MTEEEAKEKWCPMASNRMVSISEKDGSILQKHFADRSGNLTILCIASDCMMWRTTQHNYGYCGLARKP